MATEEQNLLIETLSEYDVVNEMRFSSEVKLDRRHSLNSMIEEVNEDS